MIIYVNFFHLFAHWNVNRIYFTFPLLNKLDLIDDRENNRDPFLCDGANFTVDGYVKYNNVSDMEFFNNISIQFLYTLFKRIY
jgi:hypothetical protein